MKIQSNTRMAALVLALSVLFGTFYGGHRSLSQLRRQAELVYFQGELGDGLGIAHDLDSLVTITTNMAAFAGRNGGDPGAVDRLANAREKLRDAQTPTAQYAAVQTLTQAVEELYAQLDATRLPQEQGSRWLGLRDNYKSTLNILSHSPYNQAATQFNQTLSAFPAKLLGQATGVKALELFR